MEGGMKLEIEVMQADKVGHCTYHTVSQAVFKNIRHVFHSVCFFFNLNRPSY